MQDIEAMKRSPMGGALMTCGFHISLLLYSPPAYVNQPKALLPGLSDVNMQSCNPSHQHVKLKSQKVTVNEWQRWRENQQTPFNIPQFKVFPQSTFNFNDRKPTTSEINYLHFMFSFL
jgi:hypothetical protein